MTEPRQVALRLITAWRADPVLYRAESATPIPVEQAGEVINELVQMAGVSIRFAAEGLDVDPQDFMLILERSLEEATDDAS